MRRRLALRLLMNNGFWDSERCELVNMLSPTEFLFLLAHSGLAIEPCVGLERGEVLIDSRGEGSLQQVSI